MSGHNSHAEMPTEDDVTTDERIDALEAHVAFQGDTIRQLNDALVAQQSRLDDMQAELERLGATVRDAVTDTRVPSADDEVPPHY
jgi:uncharacterized coiled-coil protein SlyX